MLYFCEYKVEKICDLILAFKIDKNQNDQIIKLSRIYFKNVFAKTKIKIIQNVLLIHRHKKIIKKIFDYLDDIFKLKKIEIDFSDFDFSKCSNFERKILFCLYNNTKYGDTISYSKLAELAGYNKNYSRAVGNAMAKNPFPIIFPCHRVIKSNGMLGNFQAGINIKKKLLEFENLYL